jgi:hypothetical protein
VERVSCTLAAGLIALLGIVVAPAAARPAPAPAVQVEHLAALAPDARSMSVRVLASCPERWTVVEAVVTVSQPGAVGQASFPLTCIGFMQPFGVRVPVSEGTFELGEDAQVSASVVIQRGRTLRASDSRILPVEPTVLVELAETARLESGGGAVVMDLSVACNAGTNGLESSLGVFQSETRGVGRYTPVCDGAPHTFTVRVEATNGLFQAGRAQALTFTDIEHEGRIFTGFDDVGSLQIVS